MARFRLAPLELIFAFLGFVFLGLFIFLAARANFDMASGRFVLFMDERITFDGVRNIIFPGGLGEFFYNVFDGGDHRYGRVLWNSIAIFSAVPAWVFGDAGQIIAARMLQVVFIVSSVLIFSFGVVRGWSWRFALLVVLLSVPFSHYFLTLPKPEPIQLFLISVFCYFYIKTGARCSWHWVFMGMAFGAKISALPVVFVFFFAQFLCGGRVGGGAPWESLAIALSAFFLGLSVSVPILLGPIFIIVFCYWAMVLLGRRFGFSIGLMGALFVVSVLLVFYVYRENLNVWMSFTFLNTSHGADQAGITAGSWFSYYFGEWLRVPKPLGFILFISFVFYFVTYSAQTFKSKVFCSHRFAVSVIFVSGICLNLAIFVGTKRLWGFYMYSGSMLIFLGIMLMAYFDLKFSQSGNGLRFLFQLNRVFSVVLPSSLVVVSLFFWTPYTFLGLSNAALRTQSNEYASQYDSYLQIMSFLETLEVREGRRIQVMLTPSLFPPESNSIYEVREFWGPFVSWENEADVIIFGVVNTPRGAPTPTDSAEYEDFLRERDGYATHVTEPGRPCDVMPCYVREQYLANGGEILVLER